MVRKSDKFAPMLAGKADLSKLRYPVLASPKIDGVRALVRNGEVVSRKLKVFPNKAAQQFRHLGGLDGELIIGTPTDQQVRNLTSGVLNRKTDDAPGLTFYVFDDWRQSSTMGFADRLELVKNQVVHHADDDSVVIVVSHKLIDNERQLLKLEEFYLDEGYEGLVLRDPNGPYKHGRSTTKEGWMLKMKRFEDAEAAVLEVHEEMENTNRAEVDNLGHTKRSKAQAGMRPKGRAGELLVLGLNGRFKGKVFIVPIGGAGDAGKDEWWAWWNNPEAPNAGRVVTYRYFPKGVLEKPLLPTYVGLREDWDQS